MSRELLTTTATEEALCKIAAMTGESPPAADRASPAALTAMDSP
jgi:hypothetical protein